MAFFWGSDFFFFFLSTVGCSGGLHSCCSCDHSFTFWAKACSSFFPEFQAVSGICNLNIFSRKNKVAASTLKSLWCSCSLIGKNEKKAVALFSYFE